MLMCAVRAVEDFFEKLWGLTANKKNRGRQKSKRRQNAGVDPFSFTGLIRLK
jgi:hypothetical protein